MILDLSTIQEFDVIARGSDSYLSRRIKKSSGYNRSHVDVVESVNGQLRLTGAWARGIISKPMDSLIGCDVTIIRPKIELSEIMKKELSKKITSKLGSKYDFNGIFHKLVYYSTKKFSEWYNPKFDGNLKPKWIGKSKDEAFVEFYCWEFIQWLFMDFYKYLEDLPIWNAELAYFDHPEYWEHEVIGRVTQIIK